MNFQIFNTFLLGIFIISNSVFAELNDMQISAIEPDNSIKLFEQSLQQFNHQNWLKNQAAQHSRNFEKFEAYIKIVDNSFPSINIVSTDSKSFEIVVSKNIATLLSNEFLLNLFSKLNYNKDFRRSANLAIAFEAYNHYLSSQLILLELVKNSLIQANVGEPQNLDSNRLLNEIVNNEHEALKTKTQNEYFLNLSRYRKRVGALNDNSIRELLWEKINKSDRQGLYEFFNHYLPWELMSPNDTTIWKNQLRGLIDYNKENKYIYFRGAPKSFPEKSPLNLSPRENDKIQLSWPLRQFFNQEVTFWDLIGKEPPESIERMSELFLNKELLQNILVRRDYHSQGVLTKKTSASPFISHSNNASGTRSFAQSEDSNGIIKIWLISSNRMLSPNLTYMGEDEILSFLFNLPDEYLDKVTSSWNTNDIHNRVEKKLKESEARGILPEQYKVHPYRSFRGKNPFDDFSLKAACIKLYTE